MTSLRPTRITADRKNSLLRVDWSDTHESVYAFSLLRNACPCAECRDGHENMTVLPDERDYYLPIRDSPATRMRRVESVGSYAITIEWEDGHHFGIYTWSYIRALCACPACRQG